AFWRGLSTPFIMSLIVIGVGTLIYVTRDKWAKIYQLIPGSRSVNNIYNKGVSVMGTFPHKLTNTYMSSSLKHYMTYIIFVIVIGTSTIMFLTNCFFINFSHLYFIYIMMLFCYVV